MQLVVSGATSGPGRLVVERLAGVFGASAITCLVRPTSQVTALQTLGVGLHAADVTQPETYRDLLHADTVFLDMSRIRHSHHVVEALTARGVRRGFFVSTTAIYSRHPGLSELYRENEEKIRRSGICFTILRPSMIYGSPSDKNMHKLIRFLARRPLFPLFGGDSLMQPVFDQDLADGIVAALTSEVSAGQEYDFAGPQPLAYREVVKVTARKLGRTVKVVEIPHRLAENFVRIAQHIPGFPIKLEQVLRLRENKAFDSSKAQAELGFCPRDFESGIDLEISALRAARMI